MMYSRQLKLAGLLAWVCLGTVLMAACGTPSSDSGPSRKNCDPTGNSEARQACNR
jgi:hypothetical protein